MLEYADSLLCAHNVKRSVHRDLRCAATLVAVPVETPPLYIQTQQPLHWLNACRRPRDFFCGDDRLGMEIVTLSRVFTRQGQLQPQRTLIVTSRPFVFAACSGSRFIVRQRGIIFARARGRKNILSHIVIIYFIPTRLLPFAKVTPLQTHECIDRGE